MTIIPELSEIVQKLPTYPTKMASDGEIILTLGT